MKSLEEQNFEKTSDPIMDVLMEQLELYKKYSNDIKTLQKQKSELSEVFFKNKLVDNSLEMKMSDLTKEIKKTNTLIKELKNSMAHLISDSQKVFKYFSMIENTISSDLANEIHTLFKQNVKLNKKLDSAFTREIAKVYGINIEDIIGEVKEHGVQDGFILKDKSTGLRLFVKTSKVFDDKRSLDARELFIYKLLEYMKLGPETDFIIIPGSSISSGAKVCHIVTKDVGFSDDNDIHKVFFTDGLISEEDKQIDRIKHWEGSLSNSEFRARFLTLSLVNDLLHLHDALGANPRNYGSILQQNKKDEPKYFPVIVDHEVKESSYKYEPDKNPVNCLLEKLILDAFNSRYRGELISYKIINNDGWFTTDTEQTKLELEKAINAVNENFSKAYKLAANEIRGIMADFRQDFSDMAIEKCEKYFFQTDQNLKLFYEKKNTYCVSDIPKFLKELPARILKFLEKK